MSANDSNTDVNVSEKIKKGRKRSSKEFSTNVLKLDESKKKVKRCFEYKKKDDCSECILKDSYGVPCCAEISVRYCSNELIVLHKTLISHFI